MNTLSAAGWGSGGQLVCEAWGAQLGSPSTTPWGSGGAAARIAASGHHNQSLGVLWVSAGYLLCGLGSSAVPTAKEPAGEAF